MQNTLDSVKNSIIVLSEQFKSGKLTYPDYIAQYTKLANKWKKLCKPKSFTESIREEGIRITKESKGWYKYHGKNFTVEIFNEECEIKWWEVSIYADNVDPRVFNEFNEYNQFDTKLDVISALYNFDKSLC